MKFYVCITFLFLSVIVSCRNNAHDNPNALIDTAANADIDIQTVLICKGSRSYAYHDHYCDGLNRCRADIEKVSLSKARSLGRTPCQYCYQSGAPVDKKQTIRSSVREQCSAITRKGTRCSRNARSNGRCWQHGG